MNLNLAIKELYHISLILLIHLLYFTNIFHSFHLMQRMIENLKNF